MKTVGEIFWRTKGGNNSFCLFVLFATVLKNTCVCVD